jgi:hypothetical protein
MRRNLVADHITGKSIVGERPCPAPAGPAIQVRERPLSPSLFGWLPQAASVIKFRST